MFRMLVDAQADMVCVAVHPDLSQLMRDIDAARPDVIVLTSRCWELTASKG